MKCCFFTEDGDRCCVVGVCCGVGWWGVGFCV